MKFETRWAAIRHIINVIFFVLFFFGITRGQGSTTTPYDIVGWDVPAEYTTYYNLRIFTLLSNPGGGYNLNTAKIDSLMEALVVFTDTTQLEIQNDTLIISDNFSGMAAFTTTAEIDTILVTGMDSLDVVVLTIREAVPGANDPLGVNVEDGYFVARRAAAGTSGLKYNWIWIRKYQ